MSLDEPSYPDAVEQVLATVAAVCAAQGRAREVATLAVARGSIEATDYDNFRGDTWLFRLLLEIPADLYGRLADHRDVLQRSLEETVRDMGRYETLVISDVRIVPAPVAEAAWRQQAMAWLRGEGINNQGRVRSDNLAARTFDGLLFRSQAEILLYQALKPLGVSFAPLPVFIRGGESYRRIEPDSVLVQHGIAMVVEVDGDTAHRETPAEVHDRTTMLAHEGVHIERVRAAECDTPEKASACARRLVALIDKYKANRA